MSKKFVALMVFLFLFSMVCFSIAINNVGRWLGAVLSANGVKGL